MSFRFRRSVKLFPGVRMNLGLRGASLSVGGRGHSMNFSGRGIRSTVGIPGTGLSYTSSMSARSGRAPSRRQLEAAARRAAIAARHDAAVAEVEAAEAALDESLNAWRLVPDLPATEVYRAATKPRPYEVRDVPPSPPDPDEERAALRREAGAEVRAAHRAPWATAGLSVLAVGAALTVATVLAAVSGHGAAIASVVWAVVVIPGSALPAAVTIRAIAARNTVVALRTRAAVDERWDARWDEVNRRHLDSVHQWEQARDSARETHDAAEAERATWARRLVDGDVVAVEESVADSLSDVDFPYEIVCKVAVPEPDHAYVLVDLPEIEDVLPETRVRVLKDGTKREIKRPKGERVAAYGGLACGLAFLTSRVAFEAGPTLRTVTVAGYTQRRQRKTGQVDDDFVYEVAIHRDASAAVDHEEIDPAAQLEVMGARIKRAASGELGKIAAPR